MPVYMIRAGEHGPVKIGYSKSEEALRIRLAILQASNHERLSLLRLLEGDLPIERRLHSLFEHLRIHGEWFRFDEAMLGDLGTREWIAVVPLEIPLPLSPVDRRIAAGAAVSRTRRARRQQLAVGPT